MASHRYWKLKVKDFFQVYLMEVDVVFGWRLMEFSPCDMTAFCIWWEWVQCRAELPAKRSSLITSSTSSSDFSNYHFWSKSTFCDALLNLRESYQVFEVQTARSLFPEWNPGTRNLNHQALLTPGDMRTWDTFTGHYKGSLYFLFVSTPRKAQIQHIFQNLYSNSF